jgi:hypothetical protein
MIKCCGAPRPTPPCPAPSSCLLIKATRWFPAVIWVTDSVITLPIMADHTLLGPFTPCDWIAPPGQFLLALHYFPPGSMSVWSENKILITKIVRMRNSGLHLSYRVVLLAAMHSVLKNFSLTKKKKKKKISMVWVRERTIPTERPPLVGEVIANFCG